MGPCSWPRNSCDAASIDDHLTASGARGELLIAGGAVMTIVCGLVSLPELFELVHGETGLAED
jgi:hypothetical protein